jgi:predicted ferric reductase
MRLPGLLIIIISLITPLYWYVGWIAGPNGTAMFSQYIGSVAIISMAISQMLSTRIVGLETVFGGMDRIYVIHKWLGILAVIAILVHDTVDAELSGKETFLTDLGETLGEVSLYGILILVVITIVTFIPYKLWRWTHKFMGAFFVASAIHYILLMKPLDPILPIGIYMLVFCVIGILAYIYTLLPLRGGVRYVVHDVEENNATVSVTLMPVKKGISHRAGQFAFINFELPDYTEVHPFTISSAPKADGSVRFTIKRLGDYTSQIGRHLKQGVHANISRSFGHFRRKNRSPEIWIAGGIGITPFLAWAHELANSASEPKHPIELFYCVRSKDEAVHLNELQALEQWQNFNLHLVSSKEQGRLTADYIAKTVSFDVASSHAYYCGPEVMRKSMAQGLSKHGLSFSKFHYEEFEIRSGIGFRQMFSFFFKALKPSKA